MPYSGLNMFTHQFLKKACNNSGYYLVSQGQASHKPPNAQGLTWSGGVPAQATETDTVIPVLCSVMAVKHC